MGLHFLRTPSSLDQRRRDSTGPTPPDKYNNLDVWGSYGGALVIKSLYIPRGYAAVVATGGPNSDVNVVGFREHVNEDYQGLRHIKGNGPYPIQDSFYVRSFRVGAYATAQRQSSRRSPPAAPTPRRRLKSPRLGRA